MLYKYFSSGNQIVDEIIRNPIYIPHKNRLYYYEWIPYEHLKNISPIAKGGFGEIHKATWQDGRINLMSIKHNGEMEFKRWGSIDIAIKFINLSQQNNNEEIFKEINIERFMRKNSEEYLENINTIIGITQNPKTLEYGFVTEFAGNGDMRHYISLNFYSISWVSKLAIAKDIAEGLGIIHSIGMAHRDLHPGNILQLDEDWAIIGDLGLCQHENDEKTEKEIFGVIPYIPPEVLKGEKFLTAGDIYSFGILLWELSTGKPPFTDRPHDAGLVIDILNGLRPEITSLVPPCIVTIIEMCWNPNPSCRPTAEELMGKLHKLWYNLKYDKPTIENVQFQETDKLIKKILENDEPNKSLANVPPKIIYSSRILSWQLDDFSQELPNLAEINKN
ncbi:hypothetical protein G9A89_010500 [Geosiphon pyriformis]|nr:hypothetical protein G9A89_010500 [Geosiphon pyriformis]